MHWSFVDSKAVALAAGFAIKAQAISLGRFCVGSCAHCAVDPQNLQMRDLCERRFIY